MKGVGLMLKKTIPFEVYTIEDNYSDKKEGINLEELDNYIIVGITKRFSTPGYDMEVENIIKTEEGEFEINLFIIPPKEGSILLQVISYKTLAIKIDKSYLGKGPYKFKLAKIRN